MSGPFGSSQWMYNAGGDYEIENSLRFDDAGTPMLALTPGQDGNMKTFTVSVWVKVSTLDPGLIFLTGFVGDGSTTRDSMAINNEGELEVIGYSGGVTSRHKSTALLRDYNAWYHILVAIDTRIDTADDRVKLYVNGSRITDLATNTNPSEDYEYVGFNNAQPHRIGRDKGNTYADGYMAEYNFIDGLALAPTAFGETDDDYGHWKPIKYAGSYGTNGFYLDFKSSGVGTASSSTVGADRSGNDSHWTSTNLAATDQVLDSPTNNFATFSRLRGRGPTMFVNNLLTETSTNTISRSVDTNFEPPSGAWYVEVLIKVDGANSGQNATHVGVANDTFVTGNEFKGHSNGVSYCMDGQKGLDNSVSDYGATYASGDVIGIAYDTDNDNITFYKNNAAQPQLTTGFDISNGRVVVATNSSTATGQRYGVNFGQDSTFAGEKTAGGNSDANGVGDFLYAVPSGYLALCTKNLPEPTITPSEHFNTVLYTGDGSVQDITTVGFLPDFTWIKNRDTTDFHQLFDSLRGPTELLMSDSSTLEATDDDTLTAFLSNGFTTGDDLETNTDGEAYVAWNWKAGGNAAAVGSNTDGSINTTDTSANVDAGFSIITYTGNGTAGATIGHGLSKVPEMFIVRQRDQASSWWTFHKDLDATAPEDKSIRLNLDSSLSDDATIWNDTAPTSTLISLGSYADVNRDAGLFLCYAFHSVDGYCKVGSYIGNGNADGTFVNTGFRPRFILNKALYGSTSWVMTDTSRSTFNQTIGALLADNRGAEQTYTYYDIVSNGFKARNTSSWVNGNGVTNIYIAFAEQPFKYSNAR